MPKKFHLIIFTVSLLLIQQSFFAQTKKTHSLKAFDNIFETIRGGHLPTCLSMKAMHLSAMLLPKYWNMEVPL